MIQDIQRAVVPAAVSGGSATVSFFASTLPVVQWCAGAVAIVSGLLGASWAALKWWEWFKARKG